MSAKRPALLGAIGGLIGSLCCIGPLALFFFGFAGISTALSLGKYSTYFLSTAILFVIAGLCVHYRSAKRMCGAHQLRKHKYMMIVAFVVMAVVYVILAYAIAPLLAPLVYQ